MNYVVAVLPDRIKAEAAYEALKQDEVPTDTITIVGKGYQDISAYDFLDPQKQSRNRALVMGTWLVPFGFVSGYAFNVQTGYQLFSWAGAFGNHVIGGLFGALGGVMGSFFIGGGLLSFGSDNNEPSYRKPLKAGKYLIIVKGQANLINKATRVLRELKPENLRSIVDSGNV